MGIEPAKGKNDNETMHWQQREREYLTDLCHKRGLEIGVLGIKRDDYSIPEYKAAMREVEASKIERSAKDVKSLLDKEPMVKIPRKDFDELIITYKVAEAVDILYRDSCVRLREQQGLIKTLKEEIIKAKESVE